jgi:Domain of unknown function (DUF4386)
MKPMERIAEPSPRLKARIAGALYLISGQAFSFAEFSVRGKLVVGSDAAATAHNILANETLYRLGFAAELLPLYLVVTFILYDLKPVNKSLSQLAFVFSIVGCAISALNCLLHLGPLVVLRDLNSSTTFTADQLRELALTSLKLSAEGLNICMVFFGFYCFLIAYLIFRSTFLPRIIGVLLAIAGLCYLTNSFATFIAPAFAAHLYPYILIPGGAELLLAFWLLVIGVNAQRWREQASAAGVRA